MWRLSPRLLAAVGSLFLQLALTLQGNDAAGVDEAGDCAATDDM